MMKVPSLVFLPNKKTIQATDHQIKRIGIESISIFNEAIFIDRYGCMRTILETKQKGWAYLWGYSLFLKGRSVKIEFVLSDCEYISLNYLKELISEKLTQKWKPVFPHPVNKKLLNQKIMQSQTHEEIINLFLYDF
ncbi:MAG: hypothetical protein WCR52_22475 [Bacteroidota bacterium]